ncbi:MAG: hypothetical protein IMZ43_01550 [Thermoplasmata archaeon]|nr:hypothetical protein [Thermoplasmata archaeon]
MTLEDLGKFRGSKIAGNFSPLGDANKGKGPLDPQEEYIFELVDGDSKPMKSGQSAEDKAAGKEPVKKMNAALTWKEVNSGILVFQHLQIETLSWGKGPSDPFRSKVLKFMEDIGIPAPKDVLPAWGNVFIKTMKIRARVVQSTRGGNPVPDEYIFKEGSFRAYKV